MILENLVMGIIFVNILMTISVLYIFFIFPSLPICISFFMWHLTWKIQHWNSTNKLVNNLCIPSSRSAECACGKHQRWTLYSLLPLPFCAKSERTGGRPQERKKELLYSKHIMRCVSACHVTIPSLQFSRSIDTGFWRPSPIILTSV